jgi:ribokinase
MITVLGSINMDLIATVARLPKPGETVTGANFVTAPGGKGANQALAARRAGANVAMAGACGEDEFAKSALSYLRADGVNFDRIRTAAEATGVALIFVGGDGENVIAIVPGANGTVNANDARAVLSDMKRGDTLMLQMEVPANAIEVALKRAREMGITSVVNIAPITTDAARLAGMADVVIANETEFELFCGKPVLNAQTREAEMVKISHENNQTIIVTLGADGVVAVRGGVIERAKGLEIKPVDTVGAGDTFCGYLAAGLDLGLSFDVALRRAAVAGSLACLKAGAQPSIPMQTEVDQRFAPSAI